MRHYELAHLLSNIEKFPLPIWGSMFPFWNPTGVFPRSVTPTRRKGHPLVVCCFLSIQRPSGVNEGEATPGPDLARVHSGPAVSGRSGPRLSHGAVGQHWGLAPRARCDQLPLPARARGGRMSVSPRASPRSRGPGRSRCEGAREPQGPAACQSPPRPGFSESESPARRPVQVS